MQIDFLIPSQGSIFYNPGMRINAGYSPVNRLGIQSTYQRIKKRMGYFNSVPDGSLEESIEISSGFYHKWPSKNSLIHDYMFDAYLGGMMSKVEDRFLPYGHSKYSYYKGFCQLGYHIIGKNGKLSFTNRVTYLDFSEVEILGDRSEFYVSQLQKISATNPFWFLELTIKAHYGLRWFKFFCVLSGRTLNENVNTVGSIQFGINLDGHEIAQLFKKKQ